LASRFVRRKGRKCPWTYLGQSGDAVATPTPIERVHRSAQPSLLGGRRHEATGRRGKLRWHRAFFVVLASILAVLLAIVGSVWYLSGRLIAVTHVGDSYPLRVIAVDPTAGIITVDRGPDATEPGSFRLAWPRGNAVIGEIVTTTPTVTRHLSALHGRLVSGTQVGVQANPYTGNPYKALGLAFNTVLVPGALGAMPAWMVRGHRSTWAIVIHGLGGNRADTLPSMPALHALGYPILAITYRNDQGAPQSLDHRSHLGATEWHDVEAAIRYAMGHGASGVILYGYSLGGAMALIAARDSLVRPDIRAVVLDSPVLDWPATLHYAARRHGLPPPLTTLVADVVAWRDHLDFVPFDQLKQEPSLNLPVLLIQGSADTVVPPALASRFAHARPALVTYLPVPGADHVSAIDTDPSGYRDALAVFLGADP